MPRVPLHALTWSREQNLYELYTQGQLQQRFRPAEEAAWLAWLGSVSSFAFHSPGGSLNVYLERRPRGGVYWYAYHTSQGRTRKRYLGRTETLSLAHLEEIAPTLLPEQQPTQARERGMLVLSGRLAPPRLPNALVERERLPLRSRCSPPLPAGAKRRYSLPGQAGTRRRSPGSRWTSWTIARPASGFH